MIPSLLKTVLRQQTVPGLPRTERQRRLEAKSVNLTLHLRQQGHAGSRGLMEDKKTAIFPPHQNEVSRLYPGVNNLLGEGPDAQT